MNFLELQNAALGDSFDSTKYRERVKRWLNDAYRQVLRRVKTDSRVSSVTVALAAGDTSATLTAAPEDLRAVESLTFVSTLADYGVELDPVDVSEVDNWDADNPSASDGVPEFYAKVGGTVEFRPAPEVAGDLHARLRTLPARMTADDDEPIFSEDYHELLVMFARARAFRDEDDKQMADALMQDFESDLARMRVDLQGVNEDGPRQIEGCW